MAIQDKDRLADIIGINEASTRLNSFIWMYICQIDNYFLSLDINLNLHNFRNSVANVLERNLRATDLLKNHINSSLIPERNFDWITGTKRQSVWIDKNINIFGRSNLQYVLGAQDFNQFSQYKIPYFLTGRSRGIALFDYVASLLPINQRFELNTALLNAWTNQKYFERVFDWMDDGDGAKKREVFWNWMFSKKIEGVNGYPPFLDHEDFLIFIETLTVPIGEKEGYSKEVRNRWNQQKRRESEKHTKKQCNFNLPIATNEKLSKLAKKYGMSRVDVLEIIILYEAQHESYIKSWLQRIPSRNPPE